MDNKKSGGRGALYTILTCVGSANVIAGGAYWLVNDDPIMAGMCYALAAAIYSMREARG